MHTFLGLAYQPINKAYNTIAYTPCCTGTTKWDMQQGKIPSKAERTEVLGAPQENW